METDANQSTKEISCFKAYDVRGVYGETINGEVVYQIGRALVHVLSAKNVVVGQDNRASSPELAESLIKGLIDSGVCVFDIGLSGTEEVYWATTSLSACAGVQVTASHNPIQYNGLKFVGRGSTPISPHDFKKIKHIAQNKKYPDHTRKGYARDYRKIAKKSYLEKILSFVSLNDVKPLKILINSGNGAAGPTVDLIINEIKKCTDKLEFYRFLHEPDSSFPNGIPNPMLKENHILTKEEIGKVNADIGVAFDGDFDRCFFFDETGSYISGEYVVGLLASSFLSKKPNSKIVHDNRVIWNTIDVIKNTGGKPIQSKTGHSFIKETMRQEDAVYGGEMSAHHYFRDFAYCDSGMIPWLLVIEHLSILNRPLSKIISERFKAYPSSGEINYKVSNPKLYIEKIIKKYESSAESIENIDGVSMIFSTWRFNLRSSNTEPLLRLNVETKGDLKLLQEKTKELNNMIEGRYKR